jgi:hypothetical protein
MTEKKKQCFVIGPIGDHKSPDRVHADKLLKEIIKPTFRTNFKDFTVVRADTIAQPGMIDSQVISALIDAELVVADLTTRNANAFYELGIRHMLQKPVIHVYKRGERIPFDVQPYRAIEFAYDEKSDITQAKSALRKAVVQVLSPDFHIENPVTRSRAMIKMQERIAAEKESLAALAMSEQMPIAHLQGMIQTAHTGSHNASPATLARYLELIEQATIRGRTLIERISSVVVKII